MTTEQHDAKFVANAFVGQYYHILRHSPENVHRFYQENSELGRHEGNGPLTSVTTLQGINEKILSLECTRCKSEIETVDAQYSVNDAVAVLVTGCFVRDNGIKRNFAQSFILATQDTGYYVLNDICRYINEGATQHATKNLDNGLEEDECSATNEEVPSINVVNMLSNGSQVLDEQRQSPSHECSTTKEEIPSVNIVNKVSNSPQVLNEQSRSPSHECSATNEEVLSIYEVNEASNSTQVLHEQSRSPSDECSATNEEVHSVKEINEVSKQALDEKSQNPSHEETPKKSYASMVKSLKKNAPAALIVSRTLPMKQKWLMSNASTSPLVAKNSSSSSSTINSNSVQVAANGFSIYISNLSLNVTPSLLEEKFKQFGPIKSGGIYIKSNKEKGFCYGFVDFEEAGSVQSAIEASPVVICDRAAYVEGRRSTRYQGSYGNFRGEQTERHESYKSGDRENYRSGDDRQNRSSGRKGSANLRQYQRRQNQKKPLYEQA